MNVVCFQLFLTFLVFTGCSHEKQVEGYPIIDIANNAEKYQRVYCSDYFSSIDVIPLETKEECLLENASRIVYKV